MLFLVQYLEEFPDEAEGGGDGSWVQGLFGVEFSVSGRVKHGEGEEGLNESVQVRTQNTNEARSRTRTRLAWRLDGCSRHT